MSAKDTVRKKHERAKESRNLRFSKGIFGTIQKPNTDKIPGFYFAPPDFTLGKNHTLRINMAKELGEDFPEIRCFYSSVVLKKHKTDVISPLSDPWVFTKDHLVPLRRNVPNISNLQHKPLLWVPASYMVNVTLGLTPLLIRLTIRRWLSTVNYDRNTPDDKDCHNLRWTIVEMLNHFRFKEKFLWSRDANGNYWYPESKQFMDKMLRTENEFLEMSDEQKVKFCNSFTWIF